MEIIPAIDLRGGKCVRLYRGDYSKEQVFSEDPVSVAQKWESLGAPRLHIIDLDGARTGKLANLDTVRAIRQAVKLPLQVGGGIREFEAAAGVLAAGVERIILGSPAVEAPELVERLCRQFAGAVVVSIDARNGLVAIHGWQGDTTTSAIELARRIAKLGVKRIIYTDIERDGTLTGPNLAAIARLMESARLAVIASGGVSSANDLRELKKLGVEGAIVGKALYTGDVDLTEALAIAADA